jgi:hypothetical protein
MRFFFLIFILSLPVFSQTQQPEKESKDDLRAGLIMFSIEDLGEDKLYWLERTTGQDYFLRMKEDDEEKIIKISSKDAKKLDMDFATKFLKLMYELSPSPEGCKVTLRLTMKGESQDMCGKDERKAQEMIPFMKEVAKRF